MNGMGQPSADFDWGQGLFNLADTGLKVWGTVEGAKVAARAAERTPATNLGIVVGGMVLIAVLIVFVIKK